MQGAAAVAAARLAPPSACLLAMQAGAASCSGSCFRQDCSLLLPPKRKPQTLWWPLIDDSRIVYNLPARRGFLTAQINDGLQPAVVHVDCLEECCDSLHMVSCSRLQRCSALHSRAAVCALACREEPEFQALVVAAFWGLYQFALLMLSLLRAEPAAQPQRTLCDGVW
jgi:hypothetical protein